MQPTGQRKAAVASCRQFHQQASVSTIIAQNSREKREASKGIHWKSLRTFRLHLEQVYQRETKDQYWGKNLGLEENNQQLKGRILQREPHLFTFPQCIRTSNTQWRGTVGLYLDSLYLLYSLLCVSNGYDFLLSAWASTMVTLLLFV